jgi:hypothetical protein
MPNRPKLTYANVMSTIAVFLVVSGGAAYAASHLPKNSVGSEQLKKNAVNSAKVKNHSLRAVDFKSGRLPAGPRGSEGPKGATGEPGPFPDGDIPSGKTLRGSFIASGHANAGGEHAFDAISFGFTLASKPGTNIIAPEGAATSACPGTLTSPEAAPGQLCLYLDENLNASSPTLCEPEGDFCSPSEGANEQGTVVRSASVAAGEFFSWGTWAVTTP